MIGLDTLVPGEVAGALCPERLSWLEARLTEAPGRPTMIFMHHPPFETGLAMDRHMCRNGSALGALLERHPNVERVCCGHVHRLIQTHWHGTPAVICPSTAHQIAPELHGAEHSAYTLEPPGFLLHRWDGPGRLTTHFIPSGIFPGPFPFPHHV